MSTADVALFDDDDDGADDDEDEGKGLKTNMIVNEVI